jgi:hypothetical protein
MSVIQLLLVAFASFAMVDLVFAAVRRLSAG